MSTEMKKIIRFVALAILAVDCILLVSSSPVTETKWHLFAKYNELRDECLNAPREALSEETKTKVSQFASELECPKIVPFAYQLHDEERCVQWISETYAGNMEILMVLLNVEYLSLYHGLLVALQYESLNRQADLSDEQEKLKDNLQLIRTILYYYGWGVHQYDTFAKIVNLRKSRQGMNEDEDNKELELMKNVKDTFNKLGDEHGITKTVGTLPEMLVTINTFLCRFLPYCVQPVPKVDVFDDVQKNAFIKGVLESSVLDPENNKITGSKVVFIIQELVKNDFRENSLVDQAAEAGASASEKTE